MEFKFSCPNCGQHLAVTSEHVGVRMTCPACSGPFDVPAPEPSQVERKESTPSAPPLPHQPGKPITKPCAVCGGRIPIATNKCVQCDKISAERLRAASQQGYTDYAQVPFYREQWFFWLIYFSFIPIALGLLISGDIYYQRNGVVRSFGLANRIVAGIIGFFYALKLCLFVLAKLNGA